MEYQNHLLRPDEDEVDERGGKESFVSSLDREVKGIVSKEKKLVKDA